MLSGKKIFFGGLICSFIYFLFPLSVPVHSGQVLVDKVSYKQDSVSNKSLFTIPGFSARQIDSLKNTTDIYYVSFWASWCTACIANFKFSKRLQQDYKSKPVSFIYISLDEDENAWRNAIIKYNLTFSENFRIPHFQEHPFIEAHQINVLPRYIIFDKNGQTLYSAAPRPSNPEIKEVLDSLLKK